VATAVVSDWLEGDPLAPVARAALQGHPLARRTLLEEIGPSVFAVVEAVLGRTHPDIDDVAQESFVAIFIALEGFRWESTVLHFARRIALRRASVVLRHHRAIRRATSATVALEDGIEIANDGASPLESTITSRQMALLRKLIVELPEEQAETLLLQLVLGHSQEEIAESTDTPVNTVKSRLRAARATLRERIANDPALAELGET
jgi:RNA polymerase sigma-70 factor (ECF subfamily)